MAKEKRFPSDANKSKAKSAVKEADSVVEGSKQELVKVEYTKDNHHVLQGVHALRKGVNHLPKEIWVEAKKHPSVIKMIEVGHIVADPLADEAEEVEGDEADEGAEAPSEEKAPE